MDLSLIVTEIRWKNCTISVHMLSCLATSKHGCLATLYPTIMAHLFRHISLSIRTGPIKYSIAVIIPTVYPNT